eukprot:Phypoly_transcript_19555.p1 GENE.Phypoly_transcript_19555~~Phypoly_transcript_19555.p1  ORF type:complete len:217 (+),score=18.94 Phypoly_transcript_19555:66-653(+)
MAGTSSHTCVVPGQRLCPVENHIAGPGTFVHKQHIHASIVGFKQITYDGTQATVRVAREKDLNVVPEIGSIVTAKVLRINPRLASVSILCVGTKALKDPFQGIIRVQDIRATEIDKVQVYRSFRPGDIVRAEVISLGDLRAYYLSTAKNDLGVVFAQSVAGSTMIPISWEMMQCPKTKMKEYRKVARPDTVPVNS